MRLIAILLAGLLALAQPVNAQMLLLGVGVPVAGAPPPPAYSGPEDAAAQTAIYYYGLRAVSAAYATSLGAAIDLCTALDANGCPTIHVTSAGGLNSAELVSSGCSVITTCTIKTFYNQKSSNDATQATIANRATFNPSCISSLPCATSNTSVTYAIAAITATQPFSSNIVANRTGSTSSFNGVIHTSNGSFYIGFVNSTNTFGMLASSQQTATASDNAWHGMTGVANGASGIISVDNTQASANFGATNSNASASFLSLSGGAGFDGKFFEAMIFSAALSAGNITALNTNQHTYGLF